MKKTRSCLLIAFLAACLLSGCGEQERAEASTVSGENFRTAAQTELTEDAEPLYSLSEQYRITTLGMVETGISLSCEADVSSAESLMKSPAVSAMLVYCGIEKPCVRKTVTDADGNAYRYTITASYTDAFQNGMESGFSYVLAEGRIGEGTVWLGGTVIDHSEVYAVGTPISPEAAAADLRGRLAERMGDCEIVAYEMAYRNDVDYGYIIPCYMFYVKQAGREDYDLYPYRMCLYTARGSAPQSAT